MANTKITILTISDLRTEANLNRKVKTLVDEGFEVTLFAAWHKTFDSSSWQGIKLKRVKLAGGPTFIRFADFFVKALFWLFTQKADLFIAYDALPLLPLRIKKMFQKCEYVYDSIELFLGINSLVDRPLRKKFWYFYEKWGIKKALDSFTVCQLDATYLQKTYPFISPPGFVRNIPDPTDLAPRNYLREKFGTKDSVKIGIYQGMVFEGRGLDNIIKALPGIENFVLFIIGDGPVKERLKGLVEKLSVPDQVIFINAVPFRELAKFTASADIGFTVISGQGLSYIHALPNKLFEYIQAGIPVIGSNYPEIEKIINGEQIGYTVDPFSVDQIHEAVTKMLDEENYTQFKKQLSSIRLKYIWQEESKKYLEIIRHALKNPR